MVQEANMTDVCSVGWRMIKVENNGKLNVHIIWWVILNGNNDDDFWQFNGYGTSK